MGKAAQHRAWGDGGYAARIRDLPCAVGGVRCTAQVHAHHVRTIAAGGAEHDLVPLCAVHHQELHNIGRWTFLKKYGVDLEALAARLWMFRHCSLETWPEVLRVAEEASA